jgi:hypothetical protein
MVTSLIDRIADLRGGSFQNCLSYQADQAHYDLAIPCENQIRIVLHVMGQAASDSAITMKKASTTIRSRVKRSQWRAMVLCCICSGGRAQASISERPKSASLPIQYGTSRVKCADGRATWIWHVA